MLLTSVSRVLREDCLCKGQSVLLEQLKDGSVSFLSLHQRVKIISSVTLASPAQASELTMGRALPFCFARGWISTTCFCALF